MVQARKYFSDYEELMLIFQGISLAMYEANEDKEKYKLFKQGYTHIFSKAEMNDMQVLWILERLGYSIDELGTYLYKDVIVKAYETINDSSSINNMDQYRVLMTQLSNAFSSFYHYIARECKDMGVKTFHLYIEKAIENIDDTKVDVNLSKKIYGENPEELNYGLNAFQIAAYYADKYSFDNTQDYKKVLVKRLANMPNDIVLKYIF